MGKHFSEDSRVKIPALVHLSRLGYQYLSTKEIRTQVHKSTNKFRAFLNAAQVTVFSNNSEYDERETIPLSGAFYSTDGNDFFAHFREEEKAYLALHYVALCRATSFMRYLR
jgi:hypothetical protein